MAGHRVTSCRFAPVTNRHPVLRNGQAAWFWPALPLLCVTVSEFAAAPAGALGPLLQLADVAESL
jgi:hypothetical protein